MESELDQFADLELSREDCEQIFDSPSNIQLCQGESSR